ncbi:YtxH domain-containing protein [Halalkalibacter krulwichiae]|uniref:YtxH-like protein n=1 Tax=Halalkalibacter krulwichiae TaxID=199441 RepID=A0A1X9MCN0_9BACI|nr:YtxH domain-containing protein [Halalkalibacter krulwichiae]ARK31195.1 YtxH-like protein [Halalkalibacter krulwichiae]
MNNRYVISALIGGVIGAASVYFFTTDKGSQFRKDFRSKVSTFDGTQLINGLYEISKEWSEFGDVVKVKNHSTASLNISNK